ncbi:MAG TPA: hypothetical protein VNZ26_32440 [Vicinamibacterales bacterium]|nr:hypothetical protein [Vicinamibacterales bacterium]
MTVGTPGERAELTARINTIEEAYEFMLAYASQGLASDSGSEHPIRDYLRRCHAALTGLAEFVTRSVEQFDAEAAAPFHGFAAVIQSDARKAQAAVQLVLAQPSIASQLVDNLNASIHLRALLTDLFLIDEALKARK